MNKLSKKQRTVLEWFLGASRSGRDQMTVPPDITDLSCGCKRNVEDKNLFTIGQNNDGSWKHIHCQKILKDLPKTELHYRTQYFSNVKKKMVVVFEKR